MSETAVVKANSGAVEAMSAADVESLVVYGDLNKLSAAGRIRYYQKRCLDLGLDALSKPFDLLVLNGKMVLYANKGCFEQLRASRKISISIVSRERFDDLFVVTARAVTPEGRMDEAIGAVNLSGKKGEDMANAIMKAETKAKRRVTLSICGLGMLDETEVETIGGATKVLLAESGEVVGHGADSHEHTYLTAWKGKPLGTEDHVFEKGSHEYCKGCDGLWRKLSDAERDVFRNLYTAWVKVAAMPEGPREAYSKEFGEWLDSMVKAKATVGDASYYRILGLCGYAHANEVKNPEHREQIRHELTECYRTQQADKPRRGRPPKEQQASRTAETPSNTGHTQEPSPPQPQSGNVFAPECLDDQLFRKAIGRYMDRKWQKASEVITKALGNKTFDQLTQPEERKALLDALAREIPG